MTSARAALVAGGSSGIGLEIARLLAGEDHAVTIVGRRADKLDRAAEALRRDGAEVEPVAADLAHEEEVRRVVEVHRQRFGRLDTLVNSAGYGGPRGPIEAVEPHRLDLILAVDLRATMLMTRACVRDLRAAGAEHGKALVVNVASIAGLVGIGSIAVYSAAQGGKIAFGRAMQDEVAGAGVQVTTLVPGYVDTPMAGWIEDVPRAEMLQPTDLAEAVRFLLRTSPFCHVPEVQLARRTGRV